MSDLERIEERHRRAPYKVECTGKWHCLECGTAEPCDVVKLARALAQFVRAAKYTSGVSLEFATDEAERILREVAGGYDDRR